MVQPLPYQAGQEHLVLVEELARVATAQQALNKF